MRKTVLLLASTLLVVLLASGLALAATISCPNRENNVCVGTNGSDKLAGTDRADTMRGRDGNDTLRGNSGNDTMSGGYHADAMFGGAGADKLQGSLGPDRLEGGSGNDILVDIGNDVALGGSGADTVKYPTTQYGGGGADFLLSGVRMLGENGDDTIKTTPESRRVYVDSGPGEDKIIITNTDVDIHAVDGERDVIRCGNGDQTLYADSNDRVVEDFLGECETIIIR